MIIRYINSSDNRNAISQIYEESWKMLILVLFRRTI
ncbi:hypothetical protein IMSAG049_01529 [Clostridiales bacterium]|nr:hypothetical protein IMSAG049_01529 [Clostridiales bacterium]